MRSDITDTETLKIIYRLLMPENALILRLSYETGLRIGDCLKIKKDDFRQNMTIKEQKTGKKKKIRISNKLFRELTAHAVNSAGSLFLFPNRLDKNKSKTRQAVWYDIKRASKALRCRENLCPHSMRKMYAVKLLEKGYSLHEIQKKLNHDSEAVTIIYIMSELLKKNKNVHTKNT